MERSIKDHIVDALDNLLEKELKRFRDVLSSQTLYEVKIARGKVEHADSIDLANLIISHHTEGKAVEVTVMVLRKIGQNQEAAELECKAGRNAQGAQFGQQVQSFEGPANFLEKHREALIQRVAIVPPILDSLLSKKLIDNECYDEVLSETTNQRKMRRLYAMVSAWGNKEKLEFFNTLKEKQPYLIEDLMGK
ncbi:apoptosis-associated speck-like protein containing a CARD [Polypterus senegalus]|uniref:apoptosis-associated speck-like protein containing a CARD n=1 Tax=Polypterus senegalus TaxID=55291 RepID=UPI00196594E7|nr:apoptosis-associated speck-like protein containing a CARD [Polypterus senegalus]